MSDSIKISITLPVEPQELYEAWLSSETHSAFTKSNVKIEKKVGSFFSVNDSDITGKNDLLHLNKRILQSWRSKDFKEDDSDSILEIIFNKVEGGTRMVINHSNLPDNTKEIYKKSWRENYLKPMKDYFSTNIH